MAYMHKRYALSDQNRSRLKVICIITPDGPVQKTKCLFLSIFVEMPAALQMVHNSNFFHTNCFMHLYSLVQIDFVQIVVNFGQLWDKFRPCQDLRCLED